MTLFGSITKTEYLDVIQGPIIDIPLNLKQKHFFKNGTVAEAKEKFYHLVNR